MSETHTTRDRDRQRSLDISLRRGVLKPAILALLNDSPTHGYELLSALRALGLHLPAGGTLYRVLRELQNARLVRSRWEQRRAGPPRRVYEITAKGQAQLRTWAAALKDHQGVIGAVLGRFAEGSANTVAPDQGDGSVAG